jgi:hypothetical protein
MLSIYKIAGEGQKSARVMDARSLRGERGELGNLKTLTYGFTTFSQSKLEHTI